MHILMITNHGLHHWQVVPGLPDTGGQNVFVNEMSQALADLGHQVTTVNRGGFPDPVTGQFRRGVLHKGDSQRIIYLDDGLPEFVRKEDMAERIPYLVQALQRALADSMPADLIFSHYWDGAELGVEYNKTLANPVTHIWIPHSLGAIKKGNLPPEQWPGLRLDERLAHEKALFAGLDGIGSTSALISQKLGDDYDYSGRMLFLPPCVDQERYHARDVGPDHEIWHFLSQHSGLPADEIRESQIVAEISRTAITKRKDVLIKAFALLQKKQPGSFLIATIDERETALYGELTRLIEDLGIGRHVAVLGPVWEWLPVIYSITDVYCTPAIVEGFGMSAQEAAATQVPVVSSDRVPYVTEYLVGSEPDSLTFAGDHGPLLIGDGAIVVEVDDVRGFSEALIRLMSDGEMRHEMGQAAFQRTVPYFTWSSRVAAFLDEIDLNA